MKKYLNWSVLTVLVTMTMFLGFTSCDDDDDNGGGKNGNVTVCLDGVKQTVNDYSAEYDWREPFFMFHIYCGKDLVNYEDQVIVQARFWDWNFDEESVGSDLLSRKGMSLLDISVDANMFEVKSGELILLSKDTSKKQIKVQFKDLVMTYVNLTETKYPPKDLTLTGEAFFTYEESK